MDIEHDDAHDHGFLYKAAILYEATKLTTSPSKRSLLLYHPTLNTTTA